MDSGGFYAFWAWSAVVALCGFLWGNGGFESTVAKDCNQRNEMVISGTVYSCKAVALINQGVRAELK